MNRVIKVETDRYTVQTNEGTVVCYARKKVKRNSDIVVGDFVELENSDGVLSVKKVLERKNSLIRPSIANIDNIIMTIAPLPEPDFYLVDKMLVNCARRNIGFIICINKTDLDDGFVQKVVGQYGADVISRIMASVNGKKEELQALVRCDLVESVREVVGKAGILPKQIKEIAIR